MIAEAIDRKWVRGRLVIATGDGGCKASSRASLWSRASWPLIPQPRWKGPEQTQEAALDLMRRDWPRLRAPGGLCLHWRRWMRFHCGL